MEREKAKASAKNAAEFKPADKKKLREFVNTIDDLKLQQGELAQQIKEAMAAAEEAGFSKKRINDVLKLRRIRRKTTRPAYDEAQQEFEFYWEASGGDKFADALDDDAELEKEETPRAGGRGRGLN